MKPILAKVADLPPPAEALSDPDPLPENQGAELPEDGIAEEVRARMAAHEYLEAEVTVINLGLQIASFLTEGDKRRDAVLDAVIKSWLTVAGHSNE